MNRPASRPARHAGQVAAHKLCAPTAFAGAVRRDALLERLLARDAPPVVLFQGPAGHGKSTLLQQTQSAFASRGALTGWLTFDEADNDVTRFFAHMEAVVEQVARPTGHSSSIAGTNRSGRALRADWFINRLVAVGRPVALFFDEFQTLTSASIHTFFTNLCDAVPAEIRLYLGSRALPDLGLTRLEVNNRALILRPEDLCFSPAEAERFFASATGLEISADELRAMYERTEGWPAALQLYRLALGRPEVRESLHSLVGHRPQQLADYLADNVLALQPPEVQGFLLSTSILARLSAPLCDAVLGQADARDMLKHLEAAGLFLRSVDAEGQWYKYHGLFSSFLADQLQERDPKAATRIHQKAATWFFSRGMHAEAIYHAVAEGNHDLAAEILDQWATGLIRDAHLVTVERWHDRIPAAALENHPDLVTKAAYACIFLRRHDKLRPLLAVLEALPASSRKCMVTSPEVVRSMAAVVADDLAGAARIVAGVDVHDPETGEFRAFELGAAANLKGLLAIAAGELESAREWLALARAQSERGHAPFSWGYAVGMAATNLLVQGHTDQALAMFREGMDEPGISVDESFASAAVVSCYIRALYDSDQLDLAAEQFQQFHDVIQQAALLDQLAVAYLSMARIHDARGDAAAADKVLDEAEAVGYAGRWPRLLQLIGWERVRRALVGGDGPRAAEIAQRLREQSATLPQDWIPFGEDADDSHIGEIRLAIHEQRFDDALSWTGGQLTRALSQGRVRRQVKLYILEALAHHHAGSANSAHRSLRRALLLARPANLVRSFLEEGDTAIALLHEDLATFSASTSAAPDSANQALRKFLTRILVASGTLGHDVAEAREAVPPLEPLTERETEILRLLAGGATNKEIGRHVFVSENTVKFHLKNIYSKLAVGSRVQAISIARQLGLLG